MSDSSESFLQFSKSMPVSCQLANTMVGDTRNGIMWGGHLLVFNWSHAGNHWRTSRF